MNLTLPSGQYLTRFPLGDITPRTHTLVIHDVSCMVNGILTPLRLGGFRNTKAVWYHGQIVAHIEFDLELDLRRSQCQNTKEWEIVCNFDLVPKEPSNASELDIT